MILTLNFKQTRFIQKKQLRVFSLLFILALISLVYYIVYVSGGTKNATPHLMYIPIILSALFFGIPGAFVAALVGALALGPFMPQNVSLGIMQESTSWIFRWGFFTLIGVLVAVLFQWLLSYAQKEKEQSTRNLITGLPNANKLDIDLNDLISKGRHFFLLGFKIENFDDVNRYAGCEIGIKSLLVAVETLKSLLNSTVYSMYLNEFAIIAEDIDVEQARQIGLQYLNRMKIPFLLDGYHIALVIKCGLVHYPQQAQNSKDIVQKIGIAFDLKAKASALQVYDDVIAQAQKERFDLAAALLDALRNEDFYLVYQPKVSLSDGSVSGVEALIRWNRKSLSPISTDRFISIAEEMGIISDISKWVIRSSIQQAAEWKQRGVNLGIALNLSPNDLKDSSVINYLIRSIEENALDPAMIEVELTERALSKNTEAMLGLLETLRKLGVKISLDDLGTGYNSLIDLVIIPIDHIKIDKSFIENILCEEYRLLIQAIIGYAHNSDKKVIAEGVETEAQLRALETLGCDYVQGYYFSQPLPVMQVETYLAAL